jgi:predicted DNA-binding transcriptional regulator AlpA
MYTTALTNPAITELQIIRKPQAIKMLGISSANFYNKINAGLLPKKISLGPNSTGYFLHELKAVIIAMSTGKSADEIKALVIYLTEQRQHLAV